VDGVVVVTEVSVAVTTPPPIIVLSFVIMVKGKVQEQIRQVFGLLFSVDVQYL
jgi:hypothetical protein